MSFSDSMFLFEIVVEKLKSYIDCKEFYILLEFEDVFSLTLRDDNTDLSMPKKKQKKKVTVRNISARKKETLERKPLSLEGAKLQSGQSILFASSIASLVTSMESFPMELSLWFKDDPQHKLGSTQIKWSPLYTEYLHNVCLLQYPAPAFSIGTYDVFNEYTSKRIATITLNIKLTYLQNNKNSSLQSQLKDNQKSFEDTGLVLKTTIMNTSKNKTLDLKDETGIIKTKIKQSPTKSKGSKKVTNYISSVVDVINKYKPIGETEDQDDPWIESVKPDIGCNINNSIASFVKSNTDLNMNNSMAEVTKAKSCSSLKQEYKMLNYIFGDNLGPFGNKEYCVGYFTVSEDGSPKDAPVDLLCQSRHDTEGTKVCSVNLPADSLSVSECKNVNCKNKTHRELAGRPDDRILLDLKSLNRNCCEINTSKNTTAGSTDKIRRTVEEVIGGMQAKMHYGEDKSDCFCECSCSFGFVKRTTYCGICGGYEKAGEDFKEKHLQTPFPCPIFHNVVVDKKLKSTSGSDTSRKKKEAKSLKKTESEKETKKGKKKKDDNRFKFNYGYAAPQIGHSQCAMPCTGTYGTVPRRMGWLWTADNVPGLRFRPTWKPGAINKHVLHLLRLAKNPGQLISKKRRKAKCVNKKSLQRPLLVVHKKDGEFTVTMETMKTFTKPRVLNQHPYEDKPVQTYTIGRTDEENRERKKKRDREKRRLERDQRKFIQSAFQNLCNDICVKTYQQALGILPNAEDPECACYPAKPGPDKTNVDVSCSCSEDFRSLVSDTDDDEWIVEFTPPTATYDPTFRGKKVALVDSSSQYTYLDYRVKLLDVYGNPVPRFFKGPDGKTQCSDLGGFWSPDQKWLEINNDGYIAPDGKWAPIDFIGPDGEHVNCDTGKFQILNGKWLVVGIDGYVDVHGKWKAYPLPKTGVIEKKKAASRKKGFVAKKNIKMDNKVSEASWSCFGDVSPRGLSKLGIVGHGHDKRILMSTLQEMIAQGADIQLPQRTAVPRLQPKKGRKPRPPLSPKTIDEIYLNSTKCRHNVPSDKGVVAVDKYGNRTYFKMRSYKNQRPKERLETLSHHGISLSSFHAPCFHSFINGQMKKEHVYEKYNKIISDDLRETPGWRPGAISKRLLKKLNKAKYSHPAFDKPKPTKRSKKQTEDKPTLIICKRNGEYIVEMKVDSPYKNTEHTPLIYKIATPDNQEKVKARARRERRLIRKAVDEVWTDPYNPDACHDVCYKVYKQAIGLDPFDPYDPECNCPEQAPEEYDSCSCSNSIESTCSSLDVDWEIHFSPPSAFFQADKEKQLDQNLNPGGDSKVPLVKFGNFKSRLTSPGLRKGVTKSRDEHN